MAAQRQASPRGGTRPGTGPARPPAGKRPNRPSAPRSAPRGGRSWSEGWQLPPHLWFDIAAVLVLLVLAVLLVAALPVLPTAAARPLLALHRAEDEVLGGGAFFLPLLLGAAAITVVRRYHAPETPVAWLRFVGCGVLLAAWTTLADAASAGRGGFVGAELRGLVGDLLGGAGWLVWLAAVLIGLIWAFHLSLRDFWHALRRMLQAGRWSVQASAQIAAPAVRGLGRKLHHEKTVPALVAAAPASAPDAPIDLPALPVIRGMASPPKVERPAAPQKASKAKTLSLLPPSPSGIAWRLPDPDLLNYGTRVEASQESMYARADVIVRTLADFGIAARVQEIRPGPTVTQFGVRPDPGVKVARIVGLQNDLALALEARAIRVEAPVPGKPYVGIEVPNPVSMAVTLRELLESQEFTRFRGRGAGLPIVLGSDVAGEPVFGDITRMPHLLIAGATGAGKSVCINSLIIGLLCQSTPEALQLIMVDPKQVELTGYNGIPHLKAPVIVDPDKVVGALDWCIKEMEHRYALFAQGAFRDLPRYNEAAHARGEAILPYLVIIIDELADLMMTAPEQIEQQICRLAQKARATGIHLIVATQRPSVDVITGLIKANFPSRIAMAVSSGVDSKTIIDSPGAERLLGRGDMLYIPAGALRPMRAQCVWVHDKEIEAIVEFWRRQRADQGERWQSAEEQKALLESWSAPPEEDPESRLLEDAVAVLQGVAETARAQGNAPQVTLSLLQRRLRLGQSRASLLMDELFDQGYIGPPSGPTRARPILPPPPEPLANAPIPASAEAGSALEGT